MSKLQKLEFETKNLQDKIRKQMSQYSSNMRSKMAMIADYRTEFENVF